MNLEDYIDKRGESGEKACARNSKKLCVCVIIALT